MDQTLAEKISSFFQQHIHARHTHDLTVYEPKRTRQPDDRYQSSKHIWDRSCKYERVWAPPSVLKPFCSHPLLAYFKCSPAACCAVCCCTLSMCCMYDHAVKLPPCVAVIRGTFWDNLWTEAELFFFGRESGGLNLSPELRVEADADRNKPCELTRHIHIDPAVQCNWRIVNSKRLTPAYFPELSTLSWHSPVSLPTFVFACAVSSMIRCSMSDVSSEIYFISESLAFCFCFLQLLHWKEIYGNNGGIQL